jgi:hypothetical protein
MPEPMSAILLRAMSGCFPFVCDGAQIFCDLDNGVEEEAGMLRGNREFSPHPIALVEKIFKRVFSSE